MPILSGVKEIAVSRAKKLFAMTALFFYCTSANAADVFIFVSFSMPQNSLKQWTMQAKKIDAPLLLRGLVDNSMKKTLQQLISIQGMQPGVQIDPEHFKEFGITKVPAVVLSDGLKFDVVYGDQSLQSALWQIQMKGELSEEAKILREKLLEASHG